MLQSIRDTVQGWIATIIFASQIVPLLGLTLAGPEPGPLVPKLEAIAAALPTLNAATLMLSLGCVGLLVALKRWRPHWPRMLIVVALAAGAAALMRLPVATIETAFGGIPDNQPVEFEIVDGPKGPQAGNVTRAA